MNTYLPKLFDNTTVQSGKSIPGRININQAPRTVLMCIPGMTSDIVDQIIANRVLDPTTAPEDQHYEVWPLMEGIVPLKTMKALAAVHYGRRQRLSGPGDRLFREGRPDWPAGSHSRLYTTPHQAIILERYEPAARRLPRGADRAGQCPTSQVVPSPRRRYGHLSDAKILGSGRIRPTTEPLHASTPCPGMERAVRSAWPWPAGAAIAR